jgi:rare lipoprotein A
VLRGPISARAVVIVALIAISTAACGKKKVRARVPVAPARIGSEEAGLASWYGVPYDGRRTASGEVYDMRQLTAAHRELPFETWVHVTNVENGKQVDVRINDRGPFVRGRIIDLSQAAAREIDMLGPGTTKVRLRVIAGPPSTSVAIATSQSTTPAQTPSGTPTSVAAKPAPSTTSVASAMIPHYAVQAGAFSDRDRAESLRMTMVDLFADARVMSNGKNPPLWRVLVGREMTAEQASDLATRVKREVGEVFVIPEPTE